MKKTAIIDSGVKCEHPAFSGSHIKAFLSLLMIREKF